MGNSQFDLIVFGATSFVGEILTNYLCQEYGVDGEIKWAVAGRSETKLVALKEVLGEQALNLPVIIADAGSAPDMLVLCQQTRVVISTVGPYALYGEPLIKACVESGTDYIDLTGEALWVKRMIDLYESKAQETGARIVHSCGFDCIPSDLGVWYLQQQSKQRFGEYCNDIKMRVKAIKGGASGGTVASMVNIVEEATKDKELRRQLANPYSLCPKGSITNPQQRSIKGAKKDSASGNWIAPFAMAAINERVVLRSNALLSYADDFRYNEAVLMGSGVNGAFKANSMSVGLGAFILGIVFPPTRWALQKYVLPKPGEGPSLDKQEKGFFDIRFFGQTSNGKTIQTKVTGDRDPGYGSTAKMLAQAGMCLLDIDKNEKGGGFWTPATIFGDRLIERLVAKAGLIFSEL